MIDFVLGSAQHRLFVEQNGEEIRGTHHAEMTDGDFTGWVEGEHVHFKSSHRYEGGRFAFDFHGKLDGDSMAGGVDLGEYGSAQWTARRHDYGASTGVMRPVKNK